MARTHFIPASGLPAEFGSLTVALLYRARPTSRSIRHRPDSQIQLPDRPGFSVELDDSKIVSMKKIFPA